MHRRTFCALGVAGFSGTAAPPASAATPESALLEVHDLKLDGDAKLAKRCLLLTPRGAASEAVPLLILFHGLGETESELLGIHAWGERYGLVKAYERLRRPPIARTLDAHKYLLDERIGELNRALTKRPFRGVAVACPYTPNPYRTGGAKALDAYTDWIADVLIPAVRARTRILPGAKHVAIDGVSLGGYVALEVFLRRPELFGVFGVVQAAIKRDRARYYADRVAEAVERVGSRPIHVQTSSWDVYREALERFSKRLTELGVNNTWRVSPGAHNQLWLRETGSLELLFWHERKLWGA
jgi:predicted esterase